MKVKRFVAPNMRLGLKMVREELGADAIILSNKRIRDGVELLTAVDDEDQKTVIETSTSEYLAPRLVADAASAGAAVQQAEEKTAGKPSKLEIEVNRMQQQARERAALLASQLAKKNKAQVFAEQAISDIAAEQAELLRTETDEATEQADTVLSPPEHETVVVEPAVETVPANQQHSDEELSQMRYELQSMRDLLERQLSSLAWGQVENSTPAEAALWKRLKRMGIQAGIARSAIDSVDAGQPAKQQWQALMQLLQRRLPLVDTDMIMNGGTFVFAGPTGAGKTTTIGKLAARYVLKHGAEQIALVTTDRYRIAAHEQLRTIGRILNIPVKIVDKNHSLESIVFSLRHKSLILIDTAGLNGQDQRLSKQLQTVNELGSRAKTVLVMPSTSQPQVMKAAYHTYATDNLAACVITKLDEAASLGEVLSLAIEKSLPIAYSTNGQGIPDDIQTADSEYLIRRCIELAKDVDVDSHVMADEMASLWQSQA